MAAKDIHMNKNSTILILFVYKINPMEPKDLMISSSNGGHQKQTDPNGSST